MPSVGMRRTTRVFGVVKGVDGARVLRSGRRLWPESDDGKLKRGVEGDDWLKLVKTTGKGDGGGGGMAFKHNGWPRGAVKTKQQVSVIDIDDDGGEELNKPNEDSVAVTDGNGLGHDRMFGIIYRRKRTRLDAESHDFSANTETKQGPNRKMFGLHFSRRQRRKKGDSEESVADSFGSHTRALAVVVESPFGGSYCFSCFLFTVLSYVKRKRPRLKQLSAFVLSQPLNGVYASQGIHFQQDRVSSSTADAGICQIFGTTQFIPLFCVHFSAIPLCFKYIYSMMLRRSMFRSFALVNNSVDVHSKSEMMTNSPEAHSEHHILCIPSEGEHSKSRPMVPDPDDSENRLLIHPSTRGSKLASRNTQYKNVLNSRGIQKRRSSLRRRKARNPSVAGLHKSNGVLVSDLVGSRKNNIPFSSVVSNKKLRSSVQSFSSENSVVDSTNATDPSFCSTNLLVVEPDKCYRVEGAIITSEISASKELLLVVKKDGLTRYSLKAEKGMRTCSNNRFTHVIMWTLDNGWKLEFPNRQDWLVFKDLYKECSERNVPAPSSKCIPVPGVHEISCYGDDNDVPFQRPDAYISFNGDELSRAMAKSTANYDMDSEDEEWLTKLNNEFQERVSVDNFELMVDVFEKALFCNPDDFSDEKAAAVLCLDLGGREVVEAVFSYWMKKRKQKRSSLLKVFQGHQSKRASLIPKPFMRKRRSFKRQPSQSGRGKQPCVLQAMAAARDALEERNAMQKVEEAKAAANRAMELAILKRQRAQALMENADLAAYKAKMSIRIAEAARVSGSTDASAGYFLD
ncbi:Enhancer of polycomb-like protein [Quillaja saponaria]|uniref:Enhancer of polycomb-like protein n=1 Tax=Quillaja saponaria TaxID=32244 RepID=A0AAD7KM50_QUISA|nr:Enhancer of polycomb-like protein [Quillaja saponaria]